MDGEDVYERVAREHPELTGRERLLAIRELKQQQKAERRRAKNAGWECLACHETVEPVEKSGLVTLSVWAALLALASLVMSVVAGAHTFTDGTVYGGAIIVLWPVAAARTGFVHPDLFAILLAFVVCLAVGWVSGKLGERAKRDARCPECRQPMPAAPAA